MKSPVFRCACLAVLLACAVFQATPSAAAEKEKKPAGKPAASGKSGKPLKPARPDSVPMPAPEAPRKNLQPETARKPETAPAPEELESVCAALEPLILRTEMARPLSDGKKTVIVPAREDNVLGLTNFSRAEFKAAGLDWDQFLAKASAAATRLLLSMTPEVTKNKDGTLAYVTLRSDRPFAASIVLSPRLLPLFKEQFGDRLVVLMPDRNTVYVFSRNFGRFQDFGPRILQEYAAALYPCSIEAFEVSRDGLKCLGSFDDGKAAPDSSAIKPGAVSGNKASAPKAAAPSSRKKSPAPK